jgi:hypothetical protein
LLIEEFLWSRRCTFLDTIEGEGGAVMQDQVIRDLHDAGKSAWVLAELSEALSQRIPVCMVRLDSGRVYHALVSNVPFPRDPD